MSGCENWANDLKLLFKLNDEMKRKRKNQAGRLRLKSFFPSTFIHTLIFMKLPLLLKMRSHPSMYNFCRLDFRTATLFLGSERQNGDATVVIAAQTPNTVDDSIGCVRLFWGATQTHSVWMEERQRASQHSRELKRESIDQRKKKERKNQSNNINAIAVGKLLLFVRISMCFMYCFHIVPKWTMKRALN